MGNINNEMLDSQLIQPQQREILIDKCFPLVIKLSYKMFVYIKTLVNVCFKMYTIQEELILRK